MLLPSIMTARVSLIEYLYPTTGRGHTSTVTGLGLAGPFNQNDNTCLTIKIKEKSNNSRIQTCTPRDEQISRLHNQSETDFLSVIATIVL